MKRVSMVAAFCLFPAVTMAQYQSNYGNNGQDWNRENRDDRQRQQFSPGPIVEPHGGAYGGLCYGPYCGSSAGMSSNFGPQVQPHGGAYGGVCFGPNCGR